MTNTKSTIAPPATQTREHIELPDLNVAPSKQELPKKEVRVRVNPLLAAVATANANRELTYEVGPAATQKHADKIIRLLVGAGREQKEPCSVRTGYNETDKVVRFKAVDLLVRNRKPAA